ncbi:MAG: hypothetical protein L0Y56_16565 [Nitrospira sp.]|nr:hypothetical protein [Nitrospira sp.]
MATQTVTYKVRDEGDLRKQGEAILNAEGTTFSSREDWNKAKVETALNQLASEGWILKTPMVLGLAHHKSSSGEESLVAPTRYVLFVFERIETKTAKGVK